MRSSPMRWLSRRAVSSASEGEFVLLPASTVGTPLSLMLLSGVAAGSELLRSKSSRLVTDIRFVIFLPLLQGVSYLFAIVPTKHKMWLLFRCTIRQVRVAF
jgi:hypothetical protein